MNVSASVRMRAATPDDRQFLEMLFHEVHRAEFAPLEMPPAQLDALLAMQFRAQSSGYARDYPSAVDRIVLDEETGKPVGRFLVEINAEHVHLLDIALIHAARGAGLGTRLIETLLAAARDTGIPVRLKVQPGNPAFNLYSRLGFRLVSGGGQLGMEFSPARRPHEDFEPRDFAASPLPAGSEWDREVGREYTVADLPDQACPKLQLTRVLRSAGQRHFFSLIFHGPLTPILQQATYTLTPEPFASAPRGEECLIFLVPIGPEGNFMQYEAVFNS